MKQPGNSAASPGRFAPKKSGGWICLHRSLLEHARFKDPDWVAVWIYLLLNATHRDWKNVLFNGKPISLRAGQLITGRNSIAEKTGVSTSKVYRLLQQLCREQQIELLPGAKHSLVTVLNWQSYQHPEQQREQPLNKHPVPARHGSNTSVDRQAPGQTQLMPGPSCSAVMQPEQQNGTPLDSKPSQTAHKQQCYNNSERPAKLTVPERIALEKKREVLLQRISQLSADTSEQWMRDLDPHRPKQLEQVRMELAVLEKQLFES